jgi:membrane-bound lytic murein transglycosylase B
VSRKFSWTRLTTCLAIPASTVLLASSTGGGTTVARILGQVTPEILATPAAPGGAEALKPPVEIAASALDKANGAREFSLPSALLSAYQSAVHHVPASCHLSVPLLAAIGQVESGSLVGRTIDAHHRVTQPVLGPVLNGNGFAAVPDTDNGSMDGDSRWDRAMGPMQFIPSTWREYGVDANGDGVKDPQNVDDAAASAAAYLCAGGRDLGTQAGEREAVLSYNNSQAYYFLVLRWKAAFEHASSSLVVQAPDTSSAAVSVAASALLAPEGAPASPGPSVAPAPRPTAAPASPSATPRSSSSPSGHSKSGSSSDAHGGPSPSTGGHGTSPHGRPSPSGTPTPGGSTPSGPATPSGSPTPSDPPSSSGPPTPSDSPSPSPSSDPGTPASKPDDRGQEPPGAPDCTAAPAGDASADPSTDTTGTPQADDAQHAEDQVSPDEPSDDGSALSGTATDDATGDGTGDDCPVPPAESSNAQ